MHVDKVALKLDEIKMLYAEIREVPLSPKVASKEDVSKMRERIDDVFDRYEMAIQNDEKYIPLIRKELNHIILMLKRWIYYDDLECEEFFKKISKYTF